MAAVGTWLLDHAPGSTPSTTPDDTGPNTADVDLSSGDAEFVAIGAGNGLSYTATVATAATAIIGIEDISTNGNIGSSFPDGTKQLSFIIVCDIDVGDNSGPRLVQMGDDGGDGEFAIGTRPSDWLFRWSKNVGGSDVTYPVPSGSYGTGVVVVAVSIDSTETTPADRIKVYYNKVLQTATSGTITLDESIDFDRTNFNFSLGNRYTLNRNIDGKIYAAQLRTSTLTVDQVNDSHDAWIVDNDTDWETASTPVLVNDSAVGTTITSPSLTQHNSLSVDSLSVGTSISLPALTQHNILAVDNLAVASLVTEPNLAQHQILSVNDLAVAASITEPGLTQHNIIAVDNLAVGTTSTNVTLAIAGLLGVDSVSVGTTVTSPALDQHNVLVVDNMAVSSSLSESVLAQNYSLSVDNMAVGTVITQSILNTGISLLVDNLAVGTVVTVPVLDQHSVLVVDDVDVQTLLSNVSLGGAVIGCLSGKVVIAQLLDGKVSIQPLLGANVTIH